MNKLLCVKSPNGAELLDGTEVDDFTTIIVGNEYTPYGTRTFDDGVYYQLVGFLPEELYHSDLFATLPDATADEMQEQSREAITNIETVLV